MDKISTIIMSNDCWFNLQNLQRLGVIDISKESDVRKFVEDVSYGLDIKNMPILEWLFSIRTYSKEHYLAWLTYSSYFLDCGYPECWALSIIRNGLYEFDAVKTLLDYPDRFKGRFKLSLLINAKEPLMVFDVFNNLYLDTGIEQHFLTGDLFKDLFTSELRKPINYQSLLSQIKERWDNNK